MGTSAPAGGVPAGRVTGTDVARSIREFSKEIPDKHQDHRIRNLIVRDIISSPLISGDAGADTTTVAQLLPARSISAVPGVKDGWITGVVHQAFADQCPLISLFISW